MKTRPDQCLESRTNSFSSMTQHSRPIWTKVQCNLSEISLTSTGSEWAKQFSRPTIGRSDDYVESKNYLLVRTNSQRQCQPVTCSEQLFEESATCILNSVKWTGIGQQSGSDLL